MEILKKINEICDAIMIDADKNLEKAKSYHDGYINGCEKMRQEIVRAINNSVVTKEI